MKENFDDILKRRWEERQFPVDENHRAEMIRLLDGNKRRKVFPIWWLGGLVILMAFSGYFLLSKPDVPAPSQPMQQKENLPLQSEGISAIPNEDGKDQSEVSDLEPLKSETPSSSMANNQNTQSSVPNLQSSIVSPLSSNHNGESPSDNPPVAEQPIAERNVPSTQSNPQHYQVDNEEMNTVTILSNAVAVTVENSYEGQNTGPAVPGAAITIQRNLEAVKTLEALEIADLSYTSGMTVGPVEPIVRRRNSLNIFGETGLGMVLASEPDFTSGWKFRIGGGLVYDIGTGIQITLGAGYLLQHGGFDFQRTSTVDQPGFGARSSFNSLTPDRLHFIYSKLGAQYRLRRHMFAAHGGIQWLYGTQGDIYVHAQDQFGSGEEEATRYAWLSTDGLQKMHWTADVSYGYQLTPRLSIAAGTDIYFSSFTVEDPALAAEGYYWDGAYSSFHPFVTLNYLIYALR